MTKPVDPALTEQRRQKQKQWWDSMTPAERKAFDAKRRAGQLRYINGKRALDAAAKERGQ
jgi:hypothetical protein